MPYESSPHPDDTPSYTFSSFRMIVAGYAGPILETMQLIPRIHDYMPEPFDITNHAGNMWVGTLVASAASITTLVRHAQQHQRIPKIDEESFRWYRKNTVAAAVGVTALLNTITETKWGVTHLPVADALNGPVPDPLDTLYSTAWAGIAALAFWKKSHPKKMQK